jgi:hypothetical protein
LDTFLLKSEEECKGGYGKKSGTNGRIDIGKGLMLVPGAMAEVRHISV